tara:strand:- start:815 stop:3922 length:3108 start_codon:yes stop_codon:yes gene_type:complete
MFKLLFVLISSLSFFIHATDYINDKPDFYVQGNDLNKALENINLYMCFVGNGIARGSLLNKGPYKVLTNDGLCLDKFKESSSSTDSSKVAKSVQDESANNETNFKDIIYNEAIFDVKKASQTAPLTAQIWSKYGHGSTNPLKLPQDIYYDFEITKLACTTAIVEENIPCSKYGNLKLYYTYQPADDTWDNLVPIYGSLGLDTAGVTSGMGSIEIADTTLNYVAHAGQSTFNISLKNEGDISTGIFEKFRTMISGAGWPWAIAYNFYQDTSKELFCQKYAYGRMLIYVEPYNPGAANHGSNYHAFTDSANKAGPLRVNDPSLYGIGISDMTNHIKTNFIDPGYGINEGCFSLDGSQSKKIVDYYGIYDADGARVDLINKAFPISATASGTNNFPNNQMYAYANEWGVWLDPKYNTYVDENTEWKNSNPNATDAQKAKSYTIQSNPIVVSKITVGYIALDDIHKHIVQMWTRDEFWNTEYKNLGFCGVDNQDKDGNACTFYSDYVGYYDKDLNGEDGNSATKGGFVFNKYYSCSNSGCTSGTLTGANIIKFENTEWLSTMAKNFGSYSYVKSMWMHDQSARQTLHIKKESLQNQTSKTSTNGIRQEKRENVALSEMPTTLYCIEDCLSPNALNTAYQNLLSTGATIASDADQTWEKTSIAGNTNRSPESTSPYFDVGPYVKASEVNGSGALEYDWNHDSSVDSTRTNATGSWVDGIRDGQKITYTISTNKIFDSGSNSLTFNTTNKTTLKNITDVNNFLSGAHVTTQKGRNENVNWGIWGGRLMTQAQLDNMECDKNYNDFNTSNDEYEYRPGWTQLQSQEKRYCTRKFHQGNVTEYYAITFRTAPTYNLMEGNAVVTFDKPKNLIFSIPANANYPSEFHGQQYWLQFTGDGNRLNGLPMERYDTSSGNTIDNAAAWQASHRWVDSFVIQDGQSVTDADSGATYTIKSLRGQIYLKPITTSAALNLIGGGASSIPYDMEAAIPSTDLLKDLSPNNGTAANSIGAEPTAILNNGAPCVVDGIKNLKDTTGCPFWSWSN